MIQDVFCITVAWSGKLKVAESYRRNNTVSCIPSSLGLLYMKDVNGVIEIHNVHLFMLSEYLKVITVLKLYDLFYNVGKLYN